MCTLFDNQKFVLESNNDLKLMLDPVQFEQVLINLIKNAVEAMHQVNSEGLITIRWQVSAQLFKLSICDEGSGISNPDNLFVPFYSTKQHGSGIGLVLSRQVIEAHNGQLMLINRTNSKGCCAIIEIPLMH